MSIRAITLAGAAAAAFIVSSANAASVVTTYRLLDHPDGNAAPPPYGIRLDGIFGAGTGTTTFSFNTAAGVFMTVTDSSSMGGGIVINIAGEVFGGIDAGAGVNAGHAGTGTYALDFTYSVNTLAQGTGYIVNPPSATNGGTLNAINVNGDESNFQFNIFEEPGTGNPFKFLQDDHRLAGHPQFGQGYFVGRGWLSFTQGQSTGGTQDFLFIGQIVPLPGAGLLASAGLAVVATRRRRNS